MIGRRRYNPKNAPSPQVNPIEPNRYENIDVAMATASAHPEITTMLATGFRNMKTTLFLKLLKKGCVSEMEIIHQKLRTNEIINCSTYVQNTIPECACPIDSRRLKFHPLSIVAKL